MAKKRVVECYAGFVHLRGHLSAEVERGGVTPYLVISAMTSPPDKRHCFDLNEPDKRAKYGVRSVEFHSREVSIFPDSNPEGIRAFANALLSAAAELEDAQAARRLAEQARRARENGGACEVEVGSDA